jgi:hypothetical protein
MEGVTLVAAELLCSGDVEGRSDDFGEQATFSSGEASTMAMKGFVEFKGLDDRSYLVRQCPYWSFTIELTFPFQISTSGCGRFRSTIASYRISLCQDEKTCISQSYKRKICTFQPGTAGYTKGKTTAVHDTDPWKWRY